ncbi:MAG: hypothetical protein HZB33_12895 [Nitrospirae bacterium]|nr:hypothetical protein [Nitrospirota bacterium]
MVISVKKTGGFAGISEDVALIDTSRYDAALSEKIKELITGIHFFALPARLSGGTVGADFFNYEISVSEGSRRHTVTFADDGSPETLPLRTLLDALSKV